MTIQKLFLHTKSARGFALPLTLLICSILLSVATGISTILVKELYFSKVSRESQVAYYAADAGLMCATVIDDQYVDPDTGMGIFQYGSGADASTVLAKINLAQGTSLTLTGVNSIKCATSEIFNTVSPNSFTVTDFSRTNSLGAREDGKKSIFTLHMDLGGGLSRCAKVTVKKTIAYRQIISQGYTSCDTSGVTPIERAVISTTEVQ
ncbi:MAG: hypothetical protein WC444_00030 [Candidatus Paceibacterota bacterium]